MLATLAVIYLSTQNPKSFEDLEHAKLADIAGSSNFQYQANLTNIGLARNESEVFKSNKSVVTCESFDEKKQKTGSGNSTGMLSWTLTSQDLMSLSASGKATEFPNGMQAMVHPEQIMIGFPAGQQVAFGSYPQFVLKGVTMAKEDGMAVRKVVATARLKRGTATLTQWFLPTKWIVKRFSLEVKGDAASFACSGRISNLNL